jgi:acetyl esterase/lipase
MQSEKKKEQHALFYTYKPDQEFSEIFAHTGGASAFGTQPGDWLAMRKAGNAAMEDLARSPPQFFDVNTEEFTATAADGSTLSIRYFYKHGAPQPGSAVVYAHGGAMIMGSVNLFHSLIAQHVSSTGVPFLAVEYRKAPDEARGATLASDLCSGLQWLISDADKFGIDKERIALMGHSAGGGLAAGAAILAREKNLKVARQILIYPMLDDRNTDGSKDLQIHPYLTFTHADNYTGWSALLGDRVGTNDVSPVEAPARSTDLSGLAPAYIEVGELDIFRNEAIAYSFELSKAGVPVEFYLHPGVPHGYDNIPSALTQRVLADRFRVIRSL